MNAKWSDCIVLYYDMIGVKKLAPQSGAGSYLMRKFHALTLKEVPKLTNISHAYVWNDSILLLTYVDRSNMYTAAMKDADNFKRQIDNLNKCYVVAVKGRTFHTFSTNANSSKKITIIQTSSWAMANCFIIEKKLKHHRADWYVDSWIVSKIKSKSPSTKHKVTLLPSCRPRFVHTLNGYLWDN